MPFLGRIQRRDLPGQIVIPRPGCELVQAHRHTHLKGVHTAGAVRPTRVTSDGALGVSNMDIQRVGGVPLARRLEVVTVRQGRAVVGPASLAGQRKVGMGRQSERKRSGVGEAPW